MLQQMVGFFLAQFVWNLFQNCITFVHARVLLYWEREYKQAQLPINNTSHFLIRDLLEFIKISCVKDRSSGLEGLFKFHVQQAEEL